MKEIKAMFRAHELHVRAGFMSPYKMLISNHNNIIQGVSDIGPVMEQDIVNYHNHMHNSVCEGCNANMKAEPAKSLDLVMTAHTITRAHGDGFYIRSSEKL